ncbi:MAG: alpha-L-fucosidase, partial [Clostridiales bacterium]|nr:alpha-L-fucosidase [Clostridiales bacterium]
MRKVLPTPEQIEWASCELGVIIHLDLTTFARKEYNFRNHWGAPLCPALFNPSALDTDQWLESAAQMGAKYAVLVAKHCTGFCLWPTEAHAYSVKSSPWKQGEGDVVADFIASCKKHDIKPGLYYSAACNHYLNADRGYVRSGDAQEQQRYNEVVLKQLEELWTNYGKLFEIWFDGGCVPVEQGGPDIVTLLHTLQPDANVFQGPWRTRSLLRWVGNERAFAPENCSSIFNFGNQRDDGSVERADCGDTYGDVWCPAESDRPNREAPSLQGGWFWQEDEEKYIVPAEELFEMYLNSVGHNTNMLLGMAIDRDGLFPKPDAAVFTEFGERVKREFSNPLACAEIRDGDTEIILNVPEGARARYLVLGEDISKGERVTGFTVYTDGQKRYSGSVIGHKRIIR